MREQDVNALRLEIERWLRDWPELAEDIQLRADMLDAETPIADVLADLIRIGEGTRMLRDASHEQLARLKARVERFDRRVEFTRSLMLSIMSAAELRKFELAEGTVYLRNNPPQIVGIADGNKLPDDLVKIERKPDRVKIKEALQAGREIEGLALSNAPPSIVVAIR
jgi:hypothetical protein